MRRLPRGSRECGEAGTGLRVRGLNAEREAWTPGRGRAASLATSCGSASLCTQVPEFARMECLIAPKCDHMENRMLGARLARRGMRGIVSFVAPWVPLLGAVGAAMQVHAPCAARPRSSVHNSPRVCCEAAAYFKGEGLCVWRCMASIMLHATA